ncbi:MAG: hypothetical protein WA974_09285 [Thermodesulfobacteriota bacterium]
MTDPTQTYTLLTGPSKNQLSEKDLRFLQMRRRFLKSFSLMGLLFSVFLIVLFLWLFFKVPTMINPIQVERQITSNALSASALKIMAVLLPLMVLVAFFMAVSIILFGFWAFANERQYLKIIDSLLAGQQPEGSLPASTGKDLKETKRKKPAVKKR